MKMIGMLAALALVATTTSALAEKPVRPGGFGQDRAAGVEANREAGTAPGASAWGHEAARRAGTNGELNNDWKCDEGQSAPDTSAICD